MHLTSSPASLLCKQLHQRYPIFYGEGKAIIYLTYKGQREHVIFLATLGGRQVRDPYIPFLDEEYETERWMTCPKQVKD